ncbi:LysR family transcriptional regulator [Planktothrix sp. FACHB-1355]|uniref:LysR family transcriptional regulator n=1 Tax=Aerosakkonema funiforme FACHB-1375 TaxID=2949571 RepID=A0A926VD61_9CYAN|nr:MULTISPECIES: LysR family transcriptional regulator [Oscillatoriales]MBD2181648.1 LysR family transcriptional regulator [Aerosakkonema funiforme FACHB-1375]MBD3562121.1 LysR family transcriptional regulator [Planktothrix sp. FACHB-1355]
MNLAGIDLNLLVVFDALMTERHVTRAGERLNLSQPATSNALARLRSLLGDELFVRSATGLQPTPKALELAKQIQPALQQIETALLCEDSFDPATSEIVFAIGMSDYTEFVLLPLLMQKLQAVAPRVRMRVRSGDRQKLLSLLDSGELDLICGLFPEQVKWHSQQFLFQENYVCVCRRNHPLIGDSLSLEQYVAANHLLVSIKEDMIGRVDEVLASKNLKRHIAISIPHFTIAPFILAQTDLIATLAQRVARKFTEVENLKILALPLGMQGFSVYIRWHMSNENNPASVWLRKIFADMGKLVEEARAPVQ